MTNPDTKLIINDVPYLFKYHEETFTIQSIIITFLTHGRPHKLDYRLSSDFLFDVDSEHMYISLLRHEFLTDAELRHCCRNTITDREMSRGVWPTSVGSHKYSIKEELLMVAFRVQELLDSKAGKIEVNDFTASGQIIQTMR